MRSSSRPAETLGLLPLSLVGDLYLAGIEDGPLGACPDCSLGSCLSCSTPAISSSLGLSEPIRSQQVLLLDLLLGELLLGLLIGIYAFSVTHPCSALALSLSLTSLNLTLPLRELLIMADYCIARLRSTLQTTGFLGLL